MGGAHGLMGDAQGQAQDSAHCNASGRVREAPAADPKILPPGHHTSLPQKTQAAAPNSGVRGQWGERWWG